MDKLTQEMRDRDDKKHSVKFSTQDSLASFNNIYINKADIPTGCKGVRVTVEFLT